MTGTDVFADSSYFLALLNPADRDHALARAATVKHPGRLITTMWVLLEVGNAMSGSKVRAKFLTMLDRLRARPNNVIVAADQAWLDRGLALYRDRSDKDWSLTDCISFLVMQHMGVSQALTADNHFVQAGFHAILLDDV